ncbi:VOC family protein [Dinoroseobacter sp. S76]|uniref:VOC family protein n=1 Tax=Dinoroseobacter sp. S76 TaxID=3415124 RepID=UPI003C7E51A4
MSIRFGEIRQLAFVVPDIDSAMQHWAETLGVGPFCVMRRLRFATYQFEGRDLPSPVISIALAVSDTLQVELIEQHDDLASLYLDASREEAATGFHHVSSWVTKVDYDTRAARLSAEGLQIAQQGVLAKSGIRLSYWATRTADTPVTFETSDAGDPIHAGRIRRVQNAAADWDGSHPVIEVAS